MNEHCMQESGLPPAGACGNNRVVSKDQKFFDRDNFWLARLPLSTTHLVRDGLGTVTHKPRRLVDIRQENRCVHADTLNVSRLQEPNASMIFEPTPELL